MYNNLAQGMNAQEQPLLNLTLLQMLNSDMQDVLSKYILECLLLKFTNKSAHQALSPGFPAKPMSLNELVQLKRKTLIAPVARYPQVQIDLDEESENKASLEYDKDACSPAATTKTGVPASPQKFVEYEQVASSRPKPQKKTKEQLRKIKIDLAFDNETGELATRCDVVYKTILRDFRRFFLDDYKQHKLSCVENTPLTNCLLKFVVKCFSNKSIGECKVISLDLGCLLFPKEMIKDSQAMIDIEKTNHFGAEDSKGNANEIMRIHGFLYKFSIDKIEECFQNYSLCELFLYYVDSTRDSRISSNPTMHKNASIYAKARDILEGKARGSLAF